MRESFCRQAPKPIPDSTGINTVSPEIAFVFACERLSQTVVLFTLDSIYSLKITAPLPNIRKILTETVFIPVEGRIARTFGKSTPDQMTNYLPLTFIPNAGKSLSASPKANSRLNRDKYSFAGNCFCVCLRKVISNGCIVYT